MSERVRFRVDGEWIEVEPGTSLAAAILAAGRGHVRTSITGEPRGPVCGMGICFECRVTIDGQPHERSCTVACRDGMNVATTTRGPEAPRPRGTGRGLREESFDVVVVGAGPAGLAAAASAATSGATVGIVDDNPAPGGQIWRREAGEPAHDDVVAWLEALELDRVRRFEGTTIVDANGPRRLYAIDAAGTIALSTRAVVLATGATELLLPFPGWTLPNVFGAGGLQSLVKSGWKIAGKRAVVAGSGPLLLAVASFLRSHGGVVACIVEQAPRARVIAFGASLLSNPGKLAQAMALERSLRGIPRYNSSWPVRAVGIDAVERVVLRTPEGERAVDCDLLAVGFGLVPHTNLGRYLGCACDGDALEVDPMQRTTVDGIWAAGEVTGIGGVDAAIVEGRIAGYAAVGMTQRARDLLGKRDRERAFGRRLGKAFAPRDELRWLADDETIVCRCEDVSRGRLRGYASIRDAKLKTRCGMGPCQGRICGPALRFLEGWSHDRVRPPLVPVEVTDLIEIGARRTVDDKSSLGGHP